MTENEMKNVYFDWMYYKVCGNGASYRKLLYLLHDIDFTYTIAMDENRFGDGISLRYRFGYELDYDSRAVAKYLDNRPCSVLEMLVALSIRLEEHIMADPDIGDRTSVWFWTMITNLKLDKMTDSAFDKKYVDEVIQRFLDREYKPDGEGGLFRIKNCKHDLRDVEIWYQAHWYLNGVK